MNHRVGNAVVACSAIAVALFAIQQNVHLMPDAHAMFTADRERCFGVVRAGRNDCGTAKHACAGRAPRDAAGDEWLLVPAGTCAKIAGASSKAIETATN